MNAEPTPQQSASGLTEAISAAMVDLYAGFYAHLRTTATTYINDNVAEDEFTAAIERLTRRSVTAFLSANQTAPGVACELFFLEAPAAVP